MTSLAGLLLGIVLFDGVSGAASSCTNTNVTFWWRAEGTTLDANDDYSAGDTTATASGGDISISATAVKNGTNGVYDNDTASASSDYYSFTVSSNDIVSGVSGRFGAWVRYDDTTVTYPGNGTTGPGILGNRSGSSGPWVLLRFYGSSTDRKLRCEWYDGTNTYGVDTGTNSIDPDTWYFAECAWDANQSAGSDILKVYLNGTELGSSTTLTLTTFTNSGATGLRVGDWSGFFGQIYIDHIIVSSDKDKSLYDCADTLVYP